MVNSIGGVSPADAQRRLRRSSSINEGDTPDASTVRHRSRTPLGLRSAPLRRRSRTPLRRCSSKTTVTNNCSAETTAAMSSDDGCGTTLQSRSVNFYTSFKYQAYPSVYGNYGLEPIRLPLRSNACSTYLLVVGFMQSRGPTANAGGPPLCS